MTATVRTLPTAATIPLPAPVVPVPPAGYTPAELAAWQAGLAAGRAERDAAHDVEVAGFLQVTQAFLDARGARPRPRLVVA